jgi:hypothetical protein
MQYSKHTATFHKEASIMKKLFIGIFLSALAFSASAQTVTGRVYSTCGTAAYSGAVGQYGAITLDATGNLCSSSGGGGGSTTANQGTANTAANAWPAIGAASATTNISGAITLGGTFQTISASSTTRKSFEFQNNSADPCYLYFGVLGAATLNNSLKVIAGGSYLRSSGALPSDAVNLTCTTTADVFFAAVQ